MCHVHKKKNKNRTGLKKQLLKTVLLIEFFQFKSLLLLIVVYVAN